MRFSQQLVFRSQALALLRQHSVPLVLLSLLQLLFSQALVLSQVLLSLVLLLALHSLSLPPLHLLPRQAGPPVLSWEAPRLFSQALLLHNLALLPLLRSQDPVLTISQGWWVQ